MDRVRKEIARRLPGLLDEVSRIVTPPADPEAVVADCERRCVLLGAEGDLARAAVGVVGEQLRMVRLLALGAGVELGPPGLLLALVGRPCGGPAPEQAQRVSDAIASTLERSLFVRALPQASAPAVALWGGRSTAALARWTRVLLAGDPADRPSPSFEEESATAQRLVVLSNLVKSGSGPSEADLGLLRNMLRAAGLPGEASDTLREAFAASRQHPADFDVLSFPDQALALAMDVVALVWREGEPDPRERAYASRVAARVGMSIGLVL